LQVLAHAHPDRCGRVMGRQHLAANDRALQQFRERHVAAIREDDDNRRDERVILTPKQAGFTVFR